MRFPLSNTLNKTFLIEAGDTRFRLDLNKEGDRYAVARIIYESEEQADSYTSESDPGWLTHLLKSSPRPAREITLLSSRTFTFIAEMPEPARGDFRRALEMDAQTVTGLAANTAQLNHVKLPSEPGDLKCWVVQAPTVELLSYRSAVAAAGCRLFAVGHPSGILQDGFKSQLELWPESALLHVSQKSGNNEVHGWNGTTAHTEAFEESEVVAALKNKGVLLVGSGFSNIDAQTPASLTVRMNDREGVIQWCSVLAMICEPLGIPGVPYITLPKPPRSNRSLSSIAAALLGGAILFSFGHYLLLKQSQNVLTENLAHLKAPADQLAAERSRMSKLQADIKKFKSEAGAHTFANGIVPAEHRIRMGSLLKGISQSASANATLLSLSSGENGVITLEGLATTPNEPQNLAARLDTELAPSGWRVHLVRRVAELFLPGGGPWSYEIRLSPERPTLGPSEVTKDTYKGDKR